MSQLNPIATTILQSLQAQRQAGADKERQVRRDQLLEKNTAAESDRFEHQVESSEHVPAPNDEQDPNEKNKRDQQQKPKDGAPDDEPPHLDLTA